MASVGLEQYHKGMRTASVTCNWDVAVTYDQEKINALLADRYNQPGGSGMVTEVVLREKLEDRLGEYYQNWHFNLGPPLIQFNKAATFPTCSLTTPIVSGSIWTSELNSPDKKDNEQQLKANTYSITISNINLSALDGDANYKGGGKDTITFPSNVQSDRYIVVDIPTSGEQLYYAVDYPAGFNSPSPMKGDTLLTALKSFFKTNVKSIAYTLAQINNYKPTNGVLDLVPQAFRFVTYDVDTKPSVDTKLSFLTLLIQTRSGSGPGNVKDVQAQWITNWSTVSGVAPVPKTESASIIINNDFFFKVFIKPGLKQASSVTNQVVPSSDSLGGIRAQCQWPKQTSEAHQYRNSKIPPNWDKWPLQYEWYSLDVPAVQYDPNNISPLKLTFGHSNGFGKPATLNLYWQYKYKSTWTGEQVKRYSIKEPGGPLEWFPSTKKQKGSFDTTYTLNKTISLTDLTDKDFSITIGADPGDWRTEAVPDQGSGFWADIGSIFGGSTNPGTIPSFVSNTTMRGISFKFAFGTLRFFSVTNVLLPGEKVIEVNIKNGLGIPRDCVIVGNVVEPRSAFIDPPN